MDQNRAILTLIPKDKKDVKLLTNWRPLSIFKYRLQVIDKIVSE